MDQLASIEQSLEHHRRLLDECCDVDDIGWLESIISCLESLAEELLNERF